jgi:hypothetical protein
MLSAVRSWCARRRSPGQSQTATGFDDQNEYTGHQTRRTVAATRGNIRFWHPFVSRQGCRQCFRVVVGGSGMWLHRRADVRGQVFALECRVVPDCPPGPASRRSWSASAKPSCGSPPPIRSLTFATLRSGLPRIAESLPGRQQRAKTPTPQYRAEPGRVRVRCPILERTTPKRAGGCGRRSCTYRSPPGSTRSSSTSEPHCGMPALAASVPLWSARLLPGSTAIRDLRASGISDLGPLRHRLQ